MSARPAANVLMTSAAPRPWQLGTDDAREVVRSAARLRDLAALDDRNMRRQADAIRRWVAEAADLLDRVTQLEPKAMKGGAA